MRPLFRLSSLIAALFLLPCLALSQQSPDLGGLRWRMIGPFRGGRTIAVSGVESQPNTYYFGGVGGGVWKSTNGGLTWEPIFDSQPIASIGALAVAPSDPNVIYVGSGEADLRSNITYGNGVYKSNDGGKTWRHIGLTDTRHIGRIVVDPRNASVVMVAALGHAYGPNTERGVFRSTDGGANWQKVLYKDENTGAIDIAIDPDHPDTVFAALWHAQRTPWSAYPPVNGSGAIYKSVDNGKNWTPITGNGLPEGDLGRIGLAVARGTRGQRVYALIEARKAGLYRSDDGGKTWTLAGTDRRIAGRLWYFCEIDVDPKNPDVVYAPNVSIYRSTNAGKTFEAIKGAPGGDDYHTMWIDPSNPRRMIFGSDQGAGVSVDGGRTWSSWYNQPTGQFYHVSVDNQFPYHVYGAQQDSGTASTTSRSDFGSITFRDWAPVGAGESGYIAPDPTDANIVYGGDTYGGLHRFDRRIGQSQNISPSTAGFGESGGLRFTWTSPLVFSPQDPHTLYFGSQFVLRSTDRGMSWQKISPDLSCPGQPAESSGPQTETNARACGRGVVYTIAPSPVSAGQIWVGSDTGFMHLTRDNGQTWNNVTPPGLGNWSKISIIDASHFDAATAYTAIDRHRLDDAGAYIYRTHDFGEHWERINQGIPEGAYVRAVREDPVRKGLLFAGTELGVYVSLNDGDSWQPLRLNMPVTPVHDLAIRNHDLVAATHGRAFWVLDDISPLREMKPTAADAPAYLFQPSRAIRLRANVNNDTPLPPEEPAGENPPAGAILYYRLGSPVKNEVTLEILDVTGKLIRRYSSTEPESMPRLDRVPFTSYWFHPAPPLSTEAGLHRHVWDFRYAVPPMQSRGFSMATAYGQNTPAEPEGPLVVPGTYQVRLTSGGKSYTQALEVVADPRIKASADDLQQQFDLGMKIYRGLQRADQMRSEIVQYLKGDVKPETKEAIARLYQPGAEDNQGGGPPPPRLTAVINTLTRLATMTDSADAAPTAQVRAAVEEALKKLDEVEAEWKKLK
ncbi:MAG: hypothetical protein LAP21_00615 [Acidobacteriia bacterium]|nr:hypothetical protein [Terriglobia bacterium]